jgi:DNA mismatch endonuclease, patch repair protein
MTVDPLRSSTMRAVKSRDTKPEMIVRRMIHAMGKRYRLHREDLPGKPDLTFPRLRKIIFVHGCFWHGHDCKRGAREPKTNVDYWRNKIARNRSRDHDNRNKLNNLGWDVLVIWECELKNKECLAEIIKAFLDPQNIANVT